MADAPSVRLRLQGLAHELLIGGSMLLLLPRPLVVEDVWDWTRAELWQRDVEPVHIWLPDLCEPSPTTALATALDLIWPEGRTAHTVENLLQLERLPEVTVLTGWEELEPERRRSWLDLLRGWAVASTRLRMPRAVLGMASAPALLESDIDLDTAMVRWWWGSPTSLELAQMCRDGGAPSAMTRWRESMLPSLAGNDASLMESLAPICMDGKEQIIQFLSDEATRRGWTSARLTSLGAMTTIIGRDTQVAPPPPLRRLWSAGALAWTPEYGIELHSAALAALGRHDEVEHRLWRFQAALVLPLIDRARRRLCDQLTHRHGRNWPFRWCEPLDPFERTLVRQDPAACGLGHLAHLLGQRPGLLGPSDWQADAGRLCRVRNSLAHYRTITYFDFEQIWKELHADEQLVAASRG
jgi:hypothetical protein